MKNYLKTVLFSAAFLGACICHAQTTTSYVGKILVGDMPLTLVFNITTEADGNLSATMDSPDQGAFGIPATIKKHSVQTNITIPSIGAELNGVTIGTKLTGTFRQYAREYPISMSIIARPQTPRPPFPYTTEEFKTTNTTDSVNICGTLTLPIGYETMDSAQRNATPLVIMITGSGLQNRDEELFYHRPFAVIADYFARHGIASIRYDDRGIGGSTGDAGIVTMQTNLNDAETVMTWARTDGRFSRIGILGHSEGANIAIMMSAQNKTDFIISMAGCGVGGDQILEFQNRLKLEQAQVDSAIINDFCKVLREIYKVIKRDEKATNNIEFVRTLLNDAPLANEIPNVETAFISLLNIKSKWLRSFICYDPTADINKINCPALFLNGELDQQVPAEMNLSAIRSKIKTEPADKTTESRQNKHTIIKYPGLNHLFQHAESGSLGEYIMIEETISPEVTNDIMQWIKTLK